MPEQLEPNSSRSCTKYKHHPSILIWVLGNELDYIPGDPGYNKNLWDVADDLTLAANDMNPNHPVISIIGTGRKSKLTEFVYAGQGEK